MIFVNFKAFKEGTGESALALVKLLEEVASTAQIKIIPVVQALDLKELVNATKLEVWVQSVDPVEYGAHTGGVIPQEVFEIGAKGVFLNHSEKKYTNFEDLKMANEMSLGIGLKTLIFASDLEELQKILSLGPTFVSYEPPELIGSRELSVAVAHPDVIGKAASLAKDAGLPLIVGAGIHSKEDVRKSIELGASGVAVATDVVKALDPRKELLDLASGFVA